MSDYGKILMSTANAVGASLKKKMGSLTGFAPVDWAETINKLGNKLPERTVSGAVCTFSDGADDVPIKTATFNIDPTLDGVSAVNVVRTGANICNQIFELGDISASTGANIDSNVVIRTKDYISVRPETQYFIYVGDGSNLAVRTRFYDKNKNYLGYNQYDGTNVKYNSVFKTPENCYFMRFTPQTSYGTTYNDDISVNYPSTDTSYHAYNGITRTISLGQTVYGGSVTVDEDGACELTDGYKRVDMGTLNYTYVPAYQYFYAEISDKKEGMTNVKADGYTTTTVAFDGTQSDLTIKGGASNHRVFLTNRTYTDPNTLKTALSGVYLVYEVTAPTQSDLDPITPINTLLGMNNLWANTGDSEVTYFAQPNIPTEVLYKGQISTTSDHATANFTESVEDDVDILVKVYCPARSAVDYKVIKVSDIGNGLNVGFNLHTTVNCTITKTSIASYQYSGDYYDIYADILAYDSAIFN